MRVLRRLTAGGLATLIGLALTSLPAYAGSKRPTATPRPTVPSPVRPRPALAPEIYQLSPIKVNPTVQPNIMILGQHLTAATVVQVGGRPATTVQAPDAYHLLVKLPDNLSQGSYSVEVTNDGGTAMASDVLVIDESGSMPSTMTMLVGIGTLLLLVLVMRLARTPGLA